MICMYTRTDFVKRIEMSLGSYFKTRVGHDLNDNISCRIRGDRNYALGFSSGRRSGMVTVR